MNTFVSIGDSLCEYHAVEALKCKFINDKNINLFVHKVKFIDNPSLNYLQKQQSILYKSCGYFEYYSIINKINIDLHYKYFLK